MLVARGPCAQTSGTVRGDRMTDKAKSSNVLGLWIAIGIAIGAGVGLAIDYIAAGVGGGLVLGIAVGVALQQK